MSGAITEDDWIRPLVLLRDLAEQAGVTLSDEDEQAICTAGVAALTEAVADGIVARKERS